MICHTKKYKLERRQDVLMKVVVITVKSFRTQIPIKTHQIILAQICDSVKLCISACYYPKLFDKQEPIACSLNKRLAHFFNGNCIRKVQTILWNAFPTSLLFPSIRYSRRPPNRLSLAKSTVPHPETDGLAYCIIKIIKISY